jgi:hypothetical protein
MRHSVVILWCVREQLSDSETARAPIVSVGLPGFSLEFPEDDLASCP